MLQPDLVLSCGDLPFDYLEYIVTRLDVPLLYVPGNHDPSLKPPDLSWMPLRAELPKPPPGPEGCVNVDGRVVGVEGLRVAGLGGSVRYKEGPNQYSQAQMGMRAVVLDFRVRLNRVQDGRKLDVLVTHAPPYGLAGAEDAAHVGFVSFLRLIRHFQPLLALHGHVHRYGRVVPDGRIGNTRVINVVPTRMIEI